MTPVFSSPITLRISLRVWWLNVLKIDSSKLSFGNSLSTLFTNYSLSHDSFKLVSQKVFTKGRLQKIGNKTAAFHQIFKTFQIKFTASTNTKTQYFSLEQSSCSSRTMKNVFKS